MEGGVQSSRGGISSLELQGVSLRAFSCQLLSHIAAPTSTAGAKDQPKTLFGWLGWIAGLWICRPTPMPRPSTSTGKALFTLLSKDWAGDGGQSISGEVAGSYKIQLHLLFALREDLIILSFFYVVFSVVL